MAINLPKQHTFVSPTKPLRYIRATEPRLQEQPRSKLTSTLRRRARKYERSRNRARSISMVWISRSMAFCASAFNSTTLSSCMIHVQHHNGVVDSRAWAEMKQSIYWKALAHCPTASSRSCWIRLTKSSSYGRMSGAAFSFFHAFFSSSTSLPASCTPLPDGSDSERNGSMQLFCCQEAAIMMWSSFKETWRNAEEFVNMNQQMLGSRNVVEVRDSKFRVWYQISNNGTVLDHLRSCFCRHCCSAFFHILRILGDARCEPALRNDAERVLLVSPTLSGSKILVLLSSCNHGWP